MKRTTLSACFIALVLTIAAGPAAAQDGCYHYRIALVSDTMNIRQSHSAGSPVVRRAVAGESFAVSSSTQGVTYCWLNIPAGWLAWTVRVSGSQPAVTTASSGTQTTQPSNIDNCCFVNRQCQSDQEWVNGYWAYQRNECPVSSPTTQQISAQPISSTPADVDNCCFTGWHCNTDDEWARGYWAYQNNQCAAGPPPSTSARDGNIGIEGSETFQIWVKAGLDLLKRTAPQWYDFVQGATRLLKERPAGTYVLIHVESGIHETAWDANDYPNDLNIYTIAHEMIHEACHFYQYRRGDSESKCTQRRSVSKRKLLQCPSLTHMIAGVAGHTKYGLPPTWSTTDPFGGGTWRRVVKLRPMHLRADALGPWSFAGQYPP